MYNARTRNVGTSFSYCSFHAWKKRRPTERRKHDMIADRNRRLRKEPRFSGGGASCRWVASPGSTIAEYAYQELGRIVQEALAGVRWWQC